MKKSMRKFHEGTKKKIHSQKWARMEKEGITRPKDPEENARRLRAAHGKENVADIKLMEKDKK